LRDEPLSSYRPRPDGYLHYLCILLEFPYLYRAGIAWSCRLLWTWGVCLCNSCNGERPLALYHDLYWRRLGSSGRTLHWYYLCQAERMVPRHGDVRLCHYYSDP